MERIFPGNTPAMALRKLACDALLMTPTNITLFYIGEMLSIEYTCLVSLLHSENAHERILYLPVLGFKLR